MTEMITPGSPNRGRKSRNEISSRFHVLLLKVERVRVEFILGRRRRSGSPRAQISLIIIRGALWLPLFLLTRRDTRWHTHRSTSSRFHRYSPIAGYCQLSLSLSLSLASFSAAGLTAAHQLATTTRSRIFLVGWHVRVSARQGTCACRCCLGSARRSADSRRSRSTREEKEAKPSRRVANMSETRKTPTGSLKRQQEEQPSRPREPIRPPRTRTTQQARHNAAAIDRRENHGAPFVSASVEPA